MSKSNRLFLIGAAKAGTTSLYEVLKKSPEIFFPIVKEPNFFSATDMNSADFQDIYRRDIDVDINSFVEQNREWHIAHVSEKSDYDLLYERASQERWLGDASTSYLWSKAAPARIIKEFPNARIVAVLRDPADRAFSHFLMNRREGKTMYDDFISEVKSDLSAQKKGWGVSHQYVELGLYSESIKRYYDVFPSEQLLILPYSLWKSSASQFLSILESFLCLQEKIPREIPRVNKAAMPRFPALNELFQRRGWTHAVKKRLPPGLRREIGKFYFGDSELPTQTAVERQFIEELTLKDWRETQSFLSKHFDFWRS